MADTITAVDQDFARIDPVERDRREAARAREFRMRQFMERARSRGTQAFQAAEEAQALLKKAKNIKSIFTLAGGLTSLTIIGVVWTIFQWNVQMVWTVFGLPGKEFIGMPWWMVPLVLLIDFVLFIVYCAIMLVAYFYANPGEAACKIGPEVVKEFLGNGFLGALVSTGLQWGCGA